MSAGLVLSCGAVNAALSRLAIGDSLSGSAAAVARHVRECAACDAFVDAVADVRAWLEGATSPTVRRPAESELRRTAVSALTGELAARLARDLVAEVRGTEGRPSAQRRRDVARLQALHGEGLWRREPWCSLHAHVAGEAKADAQHVLGLAARLDPVGLDLALGWLGLLEGRGEGRRASRAAERLLQHVV